MISLEGGQSLTLGAEYNVNQINGSNILKINLAQIYRDNNDNNLHYLLKCSSLRVV